MLALTSRSSEADVRRGLDLGFNRYLEKLNPDDLLAEVDGLILGELDWFQFAAVVRAGDGAGRDGVGGFEGGDDVRTFFPLQRAHRIDDRSAWFDHRQRHTQQRELILSKAKDIPA